MVYSLDLDITPGGVPQIVKLSQYDKTIPEIQAVLWNGPSGYTIPTGATVWVAGTKPDKTGFEYQCTYSGSTVTIDITEQMTAVAGRVPVEVIVETATGRKGSANFFMDVEPAALSDNTIISDTDIPIIQQIPEILADCEEYAELAHQWATHGSDSEEPSATNNSKYWAEKSQEYAIGALHWKGSIAFANIPTSGMVVGDLYNITDDFTTDNRFTEGAGIECPAGTDIVWGANGKWDLPLSATNASQVKYGNSNVKTELDQINTSLTDINADLSDINNALSNKQDSSTAVKHTASTAVGGTTQPVYVDSNGNVQPTSYTVAKSVPSNAVFTDTTPTYTNVVNALGYVPNNFLLAYYTTGSKTMGANTSAQMYHSISTPSGKTGAYVFFNAFNGTTGLSLNSITWSNGGFTFWVNNHNSFGVTFTISFSAIWY